MKQSELTMENALNRASSNQMNKWMANWFLLKDDKHLAEPEQFKVDRGIFFLNFPFNMLFIFYITIKYLLDYLQIMQWPN